MLWLLSPLNLLSALRLLGNANYLQAFEPDRLQALAKLHLGANFDDYYVGLPFFGLAATICAYLWFKSNYIPRGLALYGVISSAWCVICAFVFLVFPHFNDIVNDWLFDLPMALFEMVLSFWLLFKGLKPIEPDQAQAGVA
jgi:drug/metabolite transporter (DMT)-like permease